MSFPLVSLGDFVKIARNGITPEKIQSGTNYVGLENIDSSGNFVDVKGVDAGELASSKFLFTKKQVLFGKLRPYLKKIARPDFDGICSTDILPLLPSKEIDRDYLFHTLRRQSFVDDVSSLSSGANLPRISPKVLSEMQIPLPPLEEQRRIATILDKADALRAQRRAAIGKLDELLQSVFIEMFGDPVTNPRGWERLPLHELCETPDDIKCGPFGTQLARSEFTTEGVPLWGIKNVNAMFRRPTNEFVSASTAHRLNAYALLPDDIVMTRKGTIGNCAIYPKKFPLGIMHSDLLRLRVSTARCSPIFIAHQLHESKDVEHQLSLISGGAVMPGINVGKLKSLKVYVPPLKSQNLFSHIAEKIESQKQIVRRAAKKSEILFASLQHLAFSGKL